MPRGKEGQQSLDLDVARLKKAGRRRKPYNPFADRWKFYDLGDGLLLFQAYNQGPSFRVAPRSLRPLLVEQQPIAHTSYKGKSKQGFVTSYLLKASHRELARAAEQVGKWAHIRKVHQHLPEHLIAEYSIRSEFRDVLSTGKAFQQATIDDVVEFCNRTPAKHPAASGFRQVDALVYTPKFTYINPGAHSVTKWAKGQFADICILDIGVDGGQGCFTNITPDGWYDPDGRCSYCYGYQNGPPALDTQFNIQQDEFMEGLQLVMRELEEKKHKDFSRQRLHLRLGQVTDLAAPQIVQSFPGYQDTLSVVLESLARFRKQQDLAVAFPTKLITYDPERARQLREANVTLLISIGHQDLESGAVRLGHPVEYRLEQGIRFAEQGVRTALYIARNITTTPDYMNQDTKHALDFYAQHKDRLKLQFLDFRVTRRRDALALTGSSWDECLSHGQHGLFGQKGQGSWKLTSQNYLAAHRTHPDYLKMIGNNKGDIRLCSTHVVKDEQRCGTCFLYSK